MNEHQRRAHEHPVYEGAALPQEPGWFDHYEHHNGVPVGVGVTVNVGPEVERRFGQDAVWHVSVSCYPEDPDAESPLALGDWSGEHRAAALAAQIQNATGVGRRMGETPGRDVPESVSGGMVEGEYALHLYVPLTADEREGLELPRYRPSG